MLRFLRLRFARALNLARNEEEEAAAVVVAAAEDEDVWTGESEKMEAVAEAEEGLGAAWMQTSLTTFQKVRASCLACVALVILVFASPAQMI